MFNAPPNSPKDSNASPKVKIIEERIRVRSLVYNILGVRKACWSFRMGIRMSDKRINYSH
jgi:hypothetical protein